MKLRPGLEIQGPCCGGWHVLFQPDGWENGGTAARQFLYWRCAKNGTGGAYYAGSIGLESDRHPVREPQVRAEKAMLTQFADASRPPLPASERDTYQKVVREALDMLRPAAEAWSVTMAAESSMTRLDFSRDTDAPRSLTVTTDGDDDERSKTFAIRVPFPSRTLAERRRTAFLGVPTRLARSNLRQIDCGPPCLT